MKNLFFIMMLLSTLSMTSCVKAKRKGYTPTADDKVEKSPEPPPAAESKVGCQNLSGTYYFQNNSDFLSLNFLQEQKHLHITINQTAGNLELLTGTDPVETDEGTTLVASCNADTVSLAVVGIDFSFYYKIKANNATTLTATKLDDKGQVQSTTQGVLKP